MTEPLSTEERERLTKLAEAATPRPWEAHELTPAKTGAGKWGRYYVAVAGSGYPGAFLEGVRSKADADLIAAAVNALPSLLASLATQEADTRALREALENVTDTLVWLSGFVSDNLLGTAYENWLERREGMDAACALLAALTPKAEETPE